MMKKMGVVIAALAIFSLLFTVDSFAQMGPMWKGSGGWGMGMQYSKMYNPKTVETITGVVVSVDKITPMKGMSHGVHMILKTDKETIAVHLGPSWYIENQDIKIEQKDKVEVRGSRITFEGKPAIIAAEVQKGNEILKLRDEKGLPVWSGWRRR
ncbi:MAG TPA: hypothetical protein VFG06_01340 [Thermodesulfovibrionales bacterium]|jgi:hypothetical protein|nr:hypothetical protein [Thermodesulfovibrionales bacterium]